MQYNNLIEHTSQINPKILLDLKNNIMIYITKSRYKPRYKKLKNLKLHGINPNTILKLNKKKW